MSNIIKKLKSKIKQDKDFKSRIFCYFDEKEAKFFIILCLKRPQAKKSSLILKNLSEMDEYFLELDMLEFPTKTEYSFSTLLTICASNNTELIFKNDSNEEIIFSITENILKPENSEFVNFVSRDAQERAKTVFVGGSPKSGTTWVERALNLHDDIFITGETFFFEWPKKDVLEKSIQASPRMFFQSLYPQNGFTDLHTDILYDGYLQKTLDIYSRVSNVSLIGDKTPSYSQANLVYDNHKYIHCIRHPLDVAISTAFHTANIELSKGSDQSLFSDLLNSSDLVTFFDNSNYMEIFLNDWIDINKNIYNRLQVKDNIHICYYEKLLNNFNETFKNILDFLGQDSSPEIIDSIKEGSSFKKLSGGRDHGEENTRDFFRKGVSGDYLEKLSDEIIQDASLFITERWPENPYIEIKK